MENEQLVEKFIIGYGLGGGFGGIQDYVIFEGTKEDAYKEADYEAIDMYSSYEGMYGLRSVEDIMEEDEIEDYSEAEQIYRDERESWLDTSVQLYTDELAQEIEDGYGLGGYEKE